jgi:tetratricopeptide (TPR) repeat protein
MARVRLTEIDDPMALGMRLKELREAMSLSLRDLAFPGCTAGYLSTIEHGKRVPSLQVLNALAERLGVSPSYLAKGEDQLDPTDQLDQADLLFRLGKRDEASTLFTTAIERTQGYARLRALGGLGMCNLQAGHLAEGIDLLERAREVDDRSFLSTATLVDALGRAYTNRGQYESATALFSAARQAAESTGDRLAALRMTVLLANTYIDVGDTIHSNTSLAEALIDAEDLRNPRVRANVLWTQARLHTVEGRLDLAADFARRALDSLVVTEDELAIAFAQQMLAHIELQRGDPERALELLDQASPTVEHSGDDRERASFSLEIARALIALEQEEAARERLVTISTIFAEGSGADAGRYYVSLAELYERLGDQEAALTVLDSAIEILAGHRSPYLVQAYRMQGHILEQLGRKDDALRALSAALEHQDTVANREPT